MVSYVHESDRVLLDDTAGMAAARKCPVGELPSLALMGWHSGFIACYAALANHDVDFVLIPEVPFGLDGDGGFPVLPAPAGPAARARRHRGD
jgi:hypothetical protein